jgi:RES domain-containing protein
VEINVPESLIEVPDLSNLSLDAVEQCKEFGARWLNFGASVVLEVPSIIIPRGTNLLLNPKHPDFNQCQFKSPQPFSFDPRLIKSGPVEISE